MPSFALRVDHRLAQEEALSRVKGMLNDLKSQHADRFSNLEEQWVGDDGQFSVNAMGFKIKGTISVKPTTVEFSGELPLAASPFKRKLEEVIRERAERLLG